VQSFLVVSAIHAVHACDALARAEDVANPKGISI